MVAAINKASAQAASASLPTVSLLPWPSAPVVAATIAINLLALAIPLFSIQVYDRIIAQRGYSTLYVLGAGVAAALVMELVLRLLRGRMMSQAAACTEMALSSLAFQVLTRTELRAVQQQSASRLLQSVAAISRLREFHGGQAFITLLELPFGILYLCGIAYLGGVLVVVPLLLLTIFAVRALRLGQALRTALAAREHADRDRYEFLAETLAGIHTIKACGIEQRQLRRYDRLQQQLNAGNYTTVAIANTAAGDGALYGQIMLGTMVLGGAWLAGGGWTHGLIAGVPAQSLTLGALVACVLLAGRVMQPVQRALSLWHRFQEGQLAERSLQTLHVLERRHSGLALSPSLASPAPELRHSPAALTLHALTFAYPQQPALLDGVDLTLTPGTVISIDGAAGAGKSTLLRLISGLYVPTTGNVQLDNTPLHQSDCSEPIQAVALARMPPAIAYLRHDAGILRGTVADNLTRFGLIPLADMLPLARLLGLEQDIAQLPLGYATPLLGTQADAVPPGFKQRLAFARALGLQPRMVLYDNADRGLDARGYSALTNLLECMTGQVTLVLVTGDAKIRALAQRHYYLRQGKLREIANMVRDQHMPIGVPVHTTFPALSSGMLT